MQRRNFLKRAIQAIVGLAAAPSIVNAEKPAKPEVRNSTTRAARKFHEGVRAGQVEKQPVYVIRWGENSLLFLDKADELEIDGKRLNIQEILKAID